MKPRKYRNTPVLLNGHRFDSKREAAVYGDLRILERAGRIFDLELQPSFVLEVNGKKIGKYTADFAFYQDGKLRIWDVKSPASRTQAYKLRKKLVEALYPIVVEEMA